MQACKRHDATATKAAQATNLSVQGKCFAHQALRWIKAEFDNT
jgi:hypothetical protein